MKPIHVLWIEDNPMIENYDKIDDIVVPSFRVGPEKQNKFRFSLMQHPLEVFEYLQMFSILRKNKTLLKGVQMDDFLFDMVVYDYKLLDNLNATNSNSLQYSQDIHRELIKDYSPSYKMKKLFPQLFEKYELFMDREDVRNDAFTQATFFKTTEMEGAAVIDDEFGLYCGLAILKELKDTPALGIPATLSKATRKNMSHNAQFYEWLHSYDLNRPISKSNRQSKDWDEILEISLSEFRGKLKEYILMDKIYCYQRDITALLKAVNAGKTEGLLFTYFGPYGKRTYSLEGLFCEITDIQKKKEEMANWLTIIAGSFVQLDIVRPKFDELWDAYTGKFGTRILISTYELHKPDPEADPEGYKRKADLDNIFITQGKIREEYCISFSDRLKETPGEMATGRLLVLMVCTRLYIQHQRSILRSPLNTESGQINLPLEEDDYYNALHPFCNTKAGTYNPLLLLMHKPYTPTAYYANFYNRLEKLDIPKSSRWIEFNDWITVKEKNQLNSFFGPELSGIDIPAWLK